MTDRDERGKDVTDRLSARFGGDESDEDDENGELSERAVSSEPSERSEDAQLSEPAESSGQSEPSESEESTENDESDENSETDSSDLNVEEDWMGRYMYIPPTMHKQFDDEYERLRYECGRDLEWKPKKNKHYYPVVATKGIEAVADMSPDEFVETVVGLEWFDDSKSALLSE